MLLITKGWALINGLEAVKGYASLIEPFSFMIARWSFDHHVVAHPRRRLHGRNCPLGFETSRELWLVGHLSVLVTVRSGDRLGRP